MHHTIRGAPVHTRPRRGMQCHVPLVRRYQRGSSPFKNQRSSRGQVTPAGREVEGRGAAGVGGVDRDAVGEQPQDDLGVPLRGRSVERGAAVPCPLLRVPKRAALPPAAAAAATPGAVCRDEHGRGSTTTRDRVCSFTARCVVVASVGLGAFLVIVAEEHVDDGQVAVERGHGKGGLQAGGAHARVREGRRQQGVHHQSVPPRRAQVERSGGVPRAAGVHPRSSSQELLHHRLETGLDRESQRGRRGAVAATGDVVVAAAVALHGGRRRCRRLSSEGVVRIGTGLAEQKQRGLLVAAAAREAQRRVEGAVQRAVDARGRPELPQDRLQAERSAGFGLLQEELVRIFGLLRRVGVARAGYSRGPLGAEFFSYGLSVGGRGGLFGTCFQARYYKGGGGGYVGSKLR